MIKNLSFHNCKIPVSSDPEILTMEPEQQGDPELGENLGRFLVELFGRLPDIVFIIPIIPPENSNDE